MAINLLPDTEKDQLKLAITQKKLAAALTFVVLSFICFLSLLFVVDNFLTKEIIQIEGLIKKAEVSLEQAAFQDFKAVVVKTNQQIARIKQLWQGQIKLIPLLEELAQRAPSSLYFTNLSVTEEGVLLKAKLSGLSKDRESLFYFKQNLEREGLFQNVYFTPSSWVKPVEINFSLSFDFTPVE